MFRNQNTCENMIDIFSLMWNSNMKTIKILQTILWQQIQQRRRNEQVSRKYIPLKLNQEDDNLKRWVTGSERESAIEKTKTPTDASPGQWLHRRILPNIQELYPSQTLQKTEEGNTLPKTHYEATVTLMPS